VALPCRVEAALGGEDPLAGYGEAMARPIAAMLLRVGIADTGRGAWLRDNVKVLARRLPSRWRRDPPAPAVAQLGLAWRSARIGPAAGSTNRQAGG